MQTTSFRNNYQYQYEYGLLASGCAISHHLQAEQSDQKQTVDDIENVEEFQNRQQQHERQANELHYHELDGQHQQYLAPSYQVHSYHLQQVQHPQIFSETNETVVQSQPAPYEVQFEPQIQQQHHDGYLTVEGGGLNDKLHTLNETTQDQLYQHHANVRLVEDDQPSAQPVIYHEQVQEYHLQQQQQQLSDASHQTGAGEQTYHAGAYYAHESSGQQTYHGPYVAPLDEQDQQNQEAFTLQELTQHQPEYHYLGQQQTPIVEPEEGCNLSHQPDLVVAPYLQAEQQEQHQQQHAHMQQVDQQCAPGTVEESYVSLQTAGCESQYQQQIHQQHQSSFAEVSVAKSLRDPPSSACQSHGSSADSTMSSDESLSLNRDERRAREAGIPIGYYEIVDSSIDKFNELLSRYTFSEAQLTLIKDIRRRGKNKVAAQTCRKRKMEQICELQLEVDRLVSQRCALGYECTQLVKEHEALVRDYDNIHSIIQDRFLTNKQGHSMANSTSP